MDQLQKDDAIGAQDGSKPRDVLVSSAEQIIKASSNDFEE